MSPEEEDIDNWTEYPNFHTRLTGNTDTLMHPTDIPLGLYQDLHVEYLPFPTIWCGQDRQANKDRLVKVTQSTICKWKLKS